MRTPRAQPPPVPRPLRRLVGGVLLACLLVGCGAATAGVSDPNAPAADPLAALSPCDAPPQASGDRLPEGAELPPGTVVTSVVEVDPLVIVSGYVPRTPVNVRLDYEDRDDLDILVIEDEVHESEVLVANGTHRTYAKANAVCQTGSNLTATVGSEEDAQGVPVPAGARAS